MSERTEFWVLVGLSVLFALSLLAVVTGIIGQLVTTGHVSTW